MRTCLVYIIVSSVICCETVLGEDLYSVLGVRRTASVGEIKRAYKKLAREWHPDKNKAPDANERFMKINEAYETLSDSEKRQQYDSFGTTSAQQGQQGGFHQGFDQGFNPFEAFFRAGGPFSGFSFNFGGETPMEKHRITLRAYQNTIIPESHTRPFLLYAFSDFCMACMQVEQIWDKVVSDLDTIEMGIGTVNVQLDRTVAHKIRVSSVPAIVGVVNGRVKHLSGDISIRSIREFIRKIMPSNLITEVTVNNYKQFLNGWRSDNKVRALLFDTTRQSTLRYVMVSFQFKERILAGYVQLEREDTIKLQREFNIPSLKETLLLFNEDSETPVAQLTMQQIPRSTMEETMEANMFLSLPRISSPSIFNQLCPISASAKLRRVCVILLTQNIPEHEPHRTSFRSFAQDHLEEEDRVKYTYIYEDTQTIFVNALTSGKGVGNDSSLQVAIIWRKSRNQINYDWLEGGWTLEEPESMNSRHKLLRFVDGVLHSKGAMPFMIDVPDLNDEHAQNLFFRVWQRLWDWWDAIYGFVTGFDEVTIVTVIISIVFIFLVGWLMQFLVNMENEQINREESHKRPKARPRPQPPPTVSHDGRYGPDNRPTIYMHELCAKTFNKLMVDVEPGIRAIVVLVDEPAKEKLLQRFAQVVLPYARSDAFTFSFLQLEQYMPWFRALLEQTLDSKRDLVNINLKNCLGTVLALNGPRKYYCMYHARYRFLRSTGKTGAFIGFDSDSDTDSESGKESGKLFVSDLLNGLGIWMDRVCEGTVRRLRLAEWPEMEST